MSYTIAIAGKGGTGKTTIAALLVRLLKEQKKGSILAVDADPNSNLAENLGVEVKNTIGGILDAIAADPATVPVGMSKDRFIEYEVQSAVSEAEGFDLITMGRPEGPGCYCYVNNVLRNIVSVLMKDYDYIVIDNEAGLEHFSRRTTRCADALVVVSDATEVGLRAAKRISLLINELGIKAKKNYLLINREREKSRKDKTGSTGLQYLGSVPVDEKIEKISLNGDSVWRLDSEDAGISALRKLGDKIWS